MTDLIDYGMLRALSRGDPRVESWAQERSRVAVTALTYAHFCSAVLRWQKRWSPRDASPSVPSFTEGSFEEWLSRFNEEHLEVLPVTEKIALLAAQMFRDEIACSSPLTLHECIIAATAQNEHKALVTLRQERWARVSGLLVKAPSPVASSTERFARL